jgi:LPS-assembly protein
MTKLSAIAPLVFLIVAVPFISLAQEQESWEVGALNKILPGTSVGSVFFENGVWHGTNGVYVMRGDTTLTADSASVNLQSGETVADGNVRIEQGAEIWVGEHITYNFKTHQMRSEEFRTGKAPVFAAGKELQGDTSNKVYNVRHAFVTTDDVSDPAIRIRASHVKIIPGQYLEAWNAVLYLDGVPAFYFPYYKRVLGERANNFNFMAGYRSAYGPFLLNTYSYYIGEAVDGKIHLDYREKRGVGAGPDLNLHLGQWGDASFSYYYLHDHDPNESISGNIFSNLLGTIPENRQRFYFAYQATPFTNLNVKALVNYQNDPLVLHDFFEGEYTQNPQPNTFTEINKYSENWSLDAETTPRVNGFFDQVERLPDVKLTGFRQQIFNTPVYYESESSAGYYREMFADTNDPALPDYAAARADTFHQLLLPWTFFNWLNVTPHVGGHFTYYSSESGPGGTNGEAYRTIFNTGIGASFKASQLWAGATNSLLEINGLRHIIEPSVNYVYVPNPSTPPSQLPQFDSQLPSLELLPIQFPDYNNIDSIESQNVIRFGLRNTLQTKRDGQLDNLLDWNLMLDWNLTPNARTNAIFLQPQKTFDDLYSDLTFKPRSWISLESQTRYSINSRDLNFTFEQLELTPNDRWSWGLGYWYLRDGFLGSGDNLITSTMFYRLNDNWGFRATHDFNVQDGRLQQQFYTIYRDMRSWTGALTFRVIDDGNGQPKDYTVAFTFSLKANPRYRLGSDTVEPYRLVGE